MILCCGEALIDMLPRLTENGENCFQPYPGGAVFNTAIALARLERNSSLFTGLSTDIFGKQLVETLSKSGVSTDLALRNSRPTTLAFVELVNGQASYAFNDENTAGRMLAEGDLPEIPEGISTLFFGGISLVVEPCATAYEALMMRSNGEKLIMLDPNIRTSFITDQSAYRARLDRMMSAADIIKLSDEDLNWVLGEGDIESLARQLMALGPRLVCITVGAKGAWGFTKDHSVFVEATKVTAKDTVGAGDTFNAGLLASLDAGGNLTSEAMDTLSESAVRDAVSMATRAAAITVSREGANPPFLHELP